MRFNSILFLGHNKLPSINEESLNIIKPNILKREIGKLICLLIFYYLMS